MRRVVAALNDFGFLEKDLKDFKYTEQILVKDIVFAVLMLLYCCLCIFPKLKLAAAYFMQRYHFPMILANPCRGFSFPSCMPACQRARRLRATSKRPPAIEWLSDYSSKMGRTASPES